MQTALEVRKLAHGAETTQEMAMVGPPPLQAAADDETMREPQLLMAA
jgi:hypothetical protein